MPNYCNYDMRIKGKPENIRELIQILRNEHPHKSFYRVFQARIENEDEIENGVVTVYGYCAWSVHSCMLEGGTSYYTTDTKPNSKGTTLDRESKRLNLTIEIFSTEPGVGFEEHIFIQNGNILSNGSVSMKEYQTDDYDTVDEFNQVTGLSITPHEFDRNDKIKIGGFPDWSFQI